MTEAQTIERLMRVLIAVGAFVTGVASTVVGSWISSRIHVYEEHRRVHLEALRDKVLMPMRTGLQEHLWPFLAHQRAIVTVVPHARTFNPNAKVTEDAESLASLLVAVFPFSRIDEGIEPALLRDAQTHHYREVMQGVDTFVKDCIDYAGKCREWVTSIAVEIPGACGLPPFVPNKTGPYVMNCLLAHFVYARVFQFPTGTLRKQEERDHWILSNGSYTAAVGKADQLDHLVEFLNRRVTLEKAQGAALLALEENLRTKFATISGDLDFAIASRRLHKRCDLVSFF
jgi:hypothetical protein